MVTIFIDTSAIFALVNSADEDNSTAWDVWKASTERGDEFLTNNYAIVESIALIQNRLGILVVHKLLDNIAPLLHIVWVDKDQHEASINHVLTANRRNLSLVDCSAFETMRGLGVETVFTFDDHFRDQGFNVIP
jgi:predicted nucleic acid-binding protein